MSASSPLPRSVLVVGAGGREHALVRALLASPARPRVICAPGNAGIADEVPCHPVATDDIPGLVDLARVDRSELRGLGSGAFIDIALKD